MNPVLPAYAGQAPESGPFDLPPWGAPAPGKPLPGDGSGDGPGPADDAKLARLVERLLDHDEDALAQLYAATASRVFGLVLRITRNTGLAEEVVEDAYWQIWRQAPRFDATRGRVLSWMLAVARSRAIDALRRDERFRHEPLPDDDQITGPESGSFPQPCDLLEASRSNGRLHQALSALDAGPRQMIALAFLRGCTHEEIAAYTGQPLGTVKSQIRRALAALKLHLEAPGEPVAELS